MHGGGGVAVDAAYAGHTMPEPFGLGDLGDVVLDQPGFVGVSQVVEVHAGDDRRIISLLAVLAGPEVALADADLDQYIKRIAGASPGTSCPASFDASKRRTNDALTDERADRARGRE